MITVLDSYNTNDYKNKGLKFKEIEPVWITFKTAIVQVYKDW